MSQYFSINLNSLPLDIALEVDLYVNSSVNNKAHFIKIFPQNETLSKDFFNHLKEKYSIVYVEEKQRLTFLKMLQKSSMIEVQEQAQVLKDSAAKYLKDIFESNGEIKTVLDAISGCSDVVTSLVGLIKNHSIDRLKQLIGQLSFHDFYTFDHSINVCMYSIGFYRHFYPQATNEKIIIMGIGALLHDLGKLQIPTAIINKPDQLTDIEFKKIKTHPQLGKEMIEGILEHLPPFVDWTIVIKIMMQHHEHYDGSGYPYGLNGDQVHHMSKVCMLADIFDALTTKRSYNTVMSTDKAVQIMMGMEGKKIDPTFLVKFLSYLNIQKVKYPNPPKLDEKFDPSIPYKEVNVIEKNFREKEIIVKVVKNKNDNAA